MMHAIKKSWVKFHTGRLCTIILESEGTEILQKIDIQKEHPLRHTVVIGLFTIKDLVNLKCTIDNALDIMERAKEL